MGTFTLVADVDGTQRVVACGEADLSVAPALGATLERALATAKRSVIVDCTKLRYLDSSTIRELLRAQAAAARHNITFGVVKPAPNVREVLVLSDVATLILDEPAR